MTHKQAMIMVARYVGVVWNPTSDRDQLLRTIIRETRKLASERDQMALVIDCAKKERS